MNQSDMNIYQKINHVMKEITTVFKGANVSTGGGGSYKAVNHDDVAALLHKPLANVGIVVLPSIVERKHESVEITSSYFNKNTNQTVETKKDQFRVYLTVAVTFVNVDDPKDLHTVNVDGWSFDNGDKAVGKALSYAVKYALLKVFMLESSDNEEDRPNNGEDQKTTGFNNLKDEFVEKKALLKEISFHLGQNPSTKFIRLKEAAGTEDWATVQEFHLHKIRQIYNNLIG